MTHGAMSNNVLRNKIFDYQVRIFSKRILDTFYKNEEPFEYKEIIKYF